MSGKRRLLAIAAGSPAFAATGSENQHYVAPECIHAPAVACVLALAIETVKAIIDAAERANALVSVAEAQKTVGHEGGVQETHVHARAASAKSKSRPSRLHWPDKHGDDNLSRDRHKTSSSPRQKPPGATFANPARSLWEKPCCAKVSGAPAMALSTLPTRQDRCVARQPIPPLLG